MAALPLPGEYWDDENGEFDAYDPYDDWADAGAQPANALGRPPVNPLVLFGLALVAFAVFALLILRTGFSNAAVSAPAIATPLLIATPGSPALPRVSGQPAAPETFAAPYDDYWVTQGLHGQSYGHMAIDIAAGQGAPIRSPIAGEVTRKFVDGVGNPVLVIENDVYQVTLLHGIYSAEVGAQVALGDIVGEESNIGYTTDSQGRLCAGRDCGYHTHLNVYDKRVGSNVNPLGLLEG